MYGSRLSQFTGHPDIHRIHIRSCFFSHQAGTAFPLCKIRGDRRRNLLPRLGNAFLYDAIIGTENNQRLFIKLYSRRTRHPGYFNNVFLENSKAA